MNKEVKEIGRELKEILEKYPNRQKEILCYIFGEDTIREIIGKPTYEELQTKVNQLETNIDEAIELVNKIKPIYKSYIWYVNLFKILKRGGSND